MRGDEHYSPEELDEPITLLRKSRVADGAGGFTETEAQVGGTHFAKVRPLRGAERLVGDGTVMATQLLFVVHSSLGVRATDVIVYQAVRYDCSPQPVLGRSFFQEVEATAGGPV